MGFMIYKTSSHDQIIVFPDNSPIICHIGCRLFKAFSELTLSVDSLVGVGVALQMCENTTLFCWLFKAPFLHIKHCKPQSLFAKIGVHKPR